MSLHSPESSCPRERVGCGRKPPHVQWPGGARIAMQFVLNYDEGGEKAVMFGDAGAEQFLSEIFNPPSNPDRHLNMETIHEYGSRAGVWRLLRRFQWFLDPVAQHDKVWTWRHIDIAQNWQKTHPFVDPQDT